MEMRQPVDERAEADTLDDAVHPQAETLDCEGSAHDPRLTYRQARRKRPIPTFDCGLPACRPGGCTDDPPSDRLHAVGACVRRPF